MATSSEVQSHLKSIEALVHRIEESSDPALTAAAKELVQLLMELHGAGLERMLEIVRQTSDAGSSIVQTFGHDELVRSLLLLYGLHPENLETRVLQGLEKARLYLASHGGNLSLVNMDRSGVVTVRLEGSCHGCSSSSATLKQAVEEALYEAAPDLTAINVLDATQGQSTAVAFVPLSRLTGDARVSDAANDLKAQPSGV